MPNFPFPAIDEQSIIADALTFATQYNIHATTGDCRLERLQETRHAAEMGGGITYQVFACVVHIALKSPMADGTRYAHVIFQHLSGNTFTEEGRESPRHSCGG